MFKYCNDNVVVSIVSGKRDWCVEVCRMFRLDVNDSGCCRDYIVILG